MPGQGTNDNLPAGPGSTSQGDEFRVLFERYHDAVFRQIALMLGRDSAAAEDVAQETWWRIARNLKTFEWRSGFYAWACSIAGNEVKRWWGRNRRPVSLEAEPSEDPREGRERDELVREALRRIPEEFRQPLLLDLWEGMSIAEISIALGVPEGTVKSRLYRAREKFRQAWQELQ
ncbi:MAG: sigma-70 family RNA polymerase sigma factor [Planctomycetes bacterium]|nr:sigma-70 family RNA polymerase sigma factor [Planctomycetota bacterium]